MVRQFAVLTSLTRAPVIDARATSDVDTFLAQWTSLQANARGPFQSVAWLTSWYATLGRRPGTQAICLTVTQDGRPVMLFPLVVVNLRGLRVVRFADADVTDYNAPLIVAGLDIDKHRLEAALRKALQGYDLLHLSRMLAAVDGRANPLVGAIATTPCAMSGNTVSVGDDYGAWLHGLGRNPRRQFERIWRVFGREPNARFEQVTDVNSGLRLLDSIDAYQRARITSLGDRFLLDKPAWHAFYEDRLRHGLADGSVVLTALYSGSELVAALYAVSDGTRCIILRVTFAGEKWKHCSPSSLLMERTMHHLHGQGLRHFDLGIGDHPYKRAFAVSAIPLLDACVPLSLKGVPYAIGWRLRRRLNKRPANANAVAD
jgi:CelD/BcsL family acetyltransferase involved in cellulose biosynthesis